MPDIVVLHYFSSVGMTIDTAALEAFLAFTGGDAVDEGASAAVTSWTQDLNISPTAPTGDVTAANLTLSNAWAVRAIGDGDPVSGGSIQTQIGITSTAFNDGGTGSIAVTPTVQVNGGGYAASQAFDSPGLVTPQRGDVRLALDLSNALQAGDYTGTYTLTVTNL